MHSPLPSGSFDRIACLLQLTSGSQYRLSGCRMISSQTGYFFGVLFNWRNMSWFRVSCNEYRSLRVSSEYYTWLWLRLGYQEVAWWCSWTVQKLLAWWSSACVDEYWRLYSVNTEKIFLLCSMLRAVEIQGTNNSINSFE